MGDFGEVVKEWVSKPHGMVLGSRRPARCFLPDGDRFRRFVMVADSVNVGSATRFRETSPSGKWLNFGAP